MRKERAVVNTNRRVKGSEEDEQIKYQRKVIREEYVTKESVNARVEEIKPLLKMK